MALILIVDDSAFQRGILRRIVTGAGHDVLEAEEGNAGLEIAAANKPDCILVDLIMSGMDGLTLLENLQGSHMDIPVIVITADTQDSTREKCMGLGAATVVLKPVKEDKLCPIIDDVLAGKGGPCETH